MVPIVVGAIEGFSFVENPHRFHGGECRYGSRAQDPVECK